MPLAEGHDTQRTAGLSLEVLADPGDDGLDLRRGRLDETGALVEDTHALDALEVHRVVGCRGRWVHDLTGGGGATEQGVHARSRIGAVAERARGQDPRRQVGERGPRPAGGGHAGVGGPRVGGQLSAVADDEQLAPSGDAREGAGEGGARGVVDDDEVEGLVPGQHLPDDEGGHGPGR